jgi:hypothetical protein
MEDSLTGLLTQTGGDLLRGAGNILSRGVAPAADVRAAEAKARWDWRMIGIIGAVVVGMVLLFKFRK